MGLRKQQLIDCQPYLHFFDKIIINHLNFAFKIFIGQVSFHESFTIIFKLIK